MKFHTENAGRGKAAFARRVGTCALSVALVGSLCNVTPALASSDDYSVVDYIVAQTSQRLASEQGTATADAQAASAEDSYSLASNESSDYKSKFSLVDEGYVTSVKNQNPWETCWAFGSIAAAETSILSELQKKASEGFDLSEKALVASVGWQVTSSVSESQAGEGYVNTSANANRIFEAGGAALCAMKAFSSGRGLVSESTASDAVYKSTNDVFHCKVTNGETGIVKYLDLTDDQIASEKAKGNTVEKLNYSGNYTDSEGNYITTNWSTSESTFLNAEYDLENGNVFPETCIKVPTETGQVVTGYSESAMAAIKAELRKGRALACSIFAEYSSPSDIESPEGEYDYINVDTWAQYTYEPKQPGHSVTIVGYDDDYATTNFKSGHQPEKAGAWLVKNSWGSTDGSFPNKQDWGENGSGYFWISYYDQSITNFTSYDFDTTETAGTDYDTVDQYDYLPVNSAGGSPMAEQYYQGNTYTATEDRTLTYVSVMTSMPNTTVSINVYALDGDAKTPSDGVKMLTKDVTFDCKGYHRVKLSDSELVPLREGQKYSVVYSEFCNDDQKYYVTLSTNSSGKPSDSQVEAKQESFEKAYKEEAENDVVVAKSDELCAQYVKEGMDKEKAKAKANEDVKAKKWEKKNASGEIELVAYVDSDECQTQVQKKVDTEGKTVVARQVEEYKNSYYTRVVNEGESFLGGSVNGAPGKDKDSVRDKSNEYAWCDWTLQVKGLETDMAKMGLSILCDNPTAKGWSKTSDWASLDSLKELQAKIDQITSAKISADGSDVYVNEQWITQAEYNALKAQLEYAQELMSAAGSDYATKMSITTPTQAEVDEALAALTLQPRQGTKALPVDNTDNNPAPASNDAAKGASASKATGDTATGMVLAVVAGVAAATAGVAAARRRAAKGARKQV